MKGERKWWIRRKVRKDKERMRKTMGNETSDHRFWFLENVISFCFLWKRWFKFYCLVFFIFVFIDFLLLFFVLCFQYFRCIYVDIILICNYTRCYFYNYFVSFRLLLDILDKFINYLQYGLYFSFQF